MRNHCYVWLLITEQIQRVYATKRQMKREFQRYFQNDVIIACKGPLRVDFNEGQLCDFLQELDMNTLIDRFIETPEITRTELLDQNEH